MQWTDEQRLAIETKNSNILLSAAAGSGKTTVLVARVLDLIVNGGANIDRMLIVTFTRAASADMRRKLSVELAKQASAGDARCRDQLLLLERASITTLHGFCSDFLRTYFESAGVDPAFRVLDDAENRRLADEALTDAMEEAYEEMAFDCLDAVSV
ncbi:MAG: UvrD-helicase domain-containing protein [Clostridia bacterium]|nr:UvrD-helicase domain-containing protein [Clostridia bacterium]